jgi:hypothetical protein
VDPSIDRIRGRDALHQPDDRVDLGQRTPAKLGGESLSRAAGLLEEEPGFIHFRLRSHPATHYSDTVLLSGQLGGGRETPYQRSKVRRWSRRLLGTTEEAHPDQKGCSADENHFHPVLKSTW